MTFQRLVVSSRMPIWALIWLTGCIHCSMAAFDLGSSTASGALWDGLDADTITFLQSIDIADLASFLRREFQMDQAATAASAEMHHENDTHEVSKTPLFDSDLNGSSTQPAVLSTHGRITEKELHPRPPMFKKKPSRCYSSSSFRSYTVPSSDMLSDQQGAVTPKSVRERNIINLKNTNKNLEAQPNAFNKKRGRANSGCYSHNCPVPGCNRARLTPDYSLEYRNLDRELFEPPITNAKLIQIHDIYHRVQDVKLSVSPKHVQYRQTTWCILHCHVNHFLLNTTEFDRVYKKLTIRDFSNFCNPSDPCAAGKLRNH